MRRASHARMPQDLIRRTQRFSLDVISFCRTLPRTDEAQEIARQLRRAGNSVRSNYRAARNGRSRAEFASRLAEAYEEADESRDWLVHLRDARIASNPALLQEATEITRILHASLKTTRSRPRP